MKAERCLLWFTLVCLAMGATHMHYRFHPPDKGIVYFWANQLIFIDLLAVNALFLSRRTAVWGLLLNSFIAFLGIIMMTDFTLVRTLNGTIEVAPGQDLLGWFLHTSFANIIITVPDFLVGLALYRLMLPSANNGAVNGQTVPGAPPVHDYSQG